MDQNEIDSLLQKLKVNPDDYKKINFICKNSYTKIYKVQDKKNNIFIKKKFLIDETNVNKHANDDNSSINNNNQNDNDDNSINTNNNNQNDNGNCNIFDPASFQSNDSNSTHTNTIDYFLREVENLIKVQYKHLPFLQIIGYNYNIKGSKPFIITKQMEGGTLDDLIENRFKDFPNPNTAKMIIFYGVSFALKFLHEKGIIHRDIKPGNIFLNEHFEPFLGDFGFARVIQESPKLTENIGTAYYMAKELIKNDTDIDPTEKIDSYSFAVTVLETLTFNLTIRNEDNKILEKNHSKCSKNKELDSYTYKDLVKNGKSYIIPDDIPECFKDMITKCLSENVDERLEMKDIVEKMERKKMILPDYDEDAFSKYVNKLKFAENHKKSLFEKKKPNKKFFIPKTTPS